ncbi:C-terminal region of aryl-sulfatase [Planctomycetales bacterium 10988]|nr:C-terminal region of aryl-sulfatase [Planctomycetales bacterium 10988]
MTLFQYLKTVTYWSLCLTAGFIISNYALIAARAAEESPNVVVIFTDDQGYSDVGCFGAEGYKTPNLDRMAEEGAKFTSFYVSQAVCSASRASLLTGCYCNRVSISGALNPRAEHGIHSDELTLAELFKSKDYVTAMYGKWHLGHHPQFLPTRNGFDEYYGLPYSNDMWPFHPTNKTFPPLPLIENETILEYNPDQTKLTTDYTKRAVKFIKTHKDEPFFVYLAHSMPHVPLFVSKKYKGKTEQGMYGDVIREIDWSVGQILKTLKELDLDEKTLVVFTSDNGPWLSYGDHAGQAKGLREGKGTSWEGGVRVPCIMRWPGKIPSGTVCEEMAATIDILPTMAGIIEAELPTDRIIDGKDIWPLMAGEPNAKTPHEVYFYYWGKELQAVRSGPWKLHFPHTYRSLVEAGSGGIPGPYKVGKVEEISLYNLEEDLAESTNVAADYPEVVERLKGYAQEIRLELGDRLTKTEGKKIRPHGELVKAEN